MRPSFFAHLHPPTIPEKQSRLRYTLGAGGVSVFLILVLFVTGAIEMFAYIPTAGEAAHSVQTITFLMPFGGFIRNLHFWAAQALVLTTLVHLLRVVFTGGYAAHRKVNYLIGLGLFVLVLFLDFTGYVMRWDTDIHWMLVTGTNLLKSIPGIGLSLYRFVVGGEVPGTPTLTRFYAWHVYGLMLGLVFFGVWHIFRVRRDGGIAASPPQERESQARISRGELVRREILAVLIASFCLVALAAFFPAPIAAPMDAPQPENAAVHAPWFFLWVQYLLRFGDPFLMGVLIPLAILTILGLLPFLLPAPAPEELGRWWPKGGRAAQVTAGVLAAGIVLLTLLQAIRF